MQFEYWFGFISSWCWHFWCCSFPFHLLSVLISQWMELVVSAFAASSNQIWNLRKYISVTSLRVLDIYSFAATSEFSTDYLKMRSWSSCQIGKWALSDGYCCVSWHFQYHMPWFLFTAMQHFKEVIAKAAICFFFRSNTPSEVFALICRIPSAPLERTKATRPASNESPQPGSFCLCCWIILQV